MTTTSINNLNPQNIENIQIPQITKDNYKEIIMDFSIDVNHRVKAFEFYYNQPGVADNAIEILSTLSIIYQMSGSSLIQQFLFLLSKKDCQISTFLKLEASKNILSYTPPNNQNNQNNKQIAYEALNNICQSFQNTQTTSRLEAITLLMNSDHYIEQSNTYFCTFINEQQIECHYRYTTILSLENLALDLIKQDLLNMFYDKIFVKFFYQENNKLISNLYTSKYKPSLDNQNFWNNIINNYIKYDDIINIYKQKIKPIKKCKIDYFIKNAHLSFLFNQQNSTYYQILSAQYLLKNVELSIDEIQKIELKILDFSSNSNLEYNRRADAADVILKFGTDFNKKIAIQIIKQLGEINGTVKTIYDNAQNVHINEIDKSIEDILAQLSDINIIVDFDTIKTDIKQKTKSKNVSFALNRIYIDKSLYSKYNYTLLNILLKIYNYIANHQNKQIKQQLYQRLIEELEEMSDTCSSGFASRLVNVLSGFDDFNLKISFEQQIISNFSGRLNAFARKICDNDSIFRLQKLNDVIILYLKQQPNIYQQIKQQITNNLTIQTLNNQIIQNFLENDIDNHECSNKSKQEKINICLNHFSEQILNELLLESSQSHNRTNFLFFLGTYISTIRQELYNEFNQFITDTDFDLFFRKAIMNYDGEILLFL